MSVPLHHAQTEHPSAVQQMNFPDRLRENIRVKERGHASDFWSFAKLDVILSIAHSNRRNTGRCIDFSIRQRVNKKEHFEKSEACGSRHSIERTFYFCTDLLDS